MGRNTRWHLSLAMSATMLPCRRYVCLLALVFWHRLDPTVWHSSHIGIKPLPDLLGDLVESEPVIDGVI